jgi:alanine racemase
VLQQDSTLKLHFSYSNIREIIGATPVGSSIEGTIDSVAIDSRRIFSGNKTVFFGLPGEFRNGEDFIGQAYENGVRLFVVRNAAITSSYPEAQFLVVENVLFALQELAAAHRKRFHYPVIGITGSAGKTTVKEWLYQLLSVQYRVIRSPKSYNSQLGVALSLLEMSDEHQIALIEAGISHPGEMKRLEYMIQPTYGVFTSFGKSHEENFSTKQAHLQEKLDLFTSSTKTFLPESILLNHTQSERIHASAVKAQLTSVIQEKLPFSDPISIANSALALAVASDFISDKEILLDQLAHLERPAMRLETFEGIKGCTVINDTYNLDPDALQYALEYQLKISANKRRIVIVGIDGQHAHFKKEVESVITRFQPDDYIIIAPGEKIAVDPTNAVILLKGTRKANMQEVALQFRLKKHKTYLEIDLSALRNNLSVFKSMLPQKTKLLVMVKAQSYGSGAEKLATFLALQGIDYLGVAYADEGIELREQGINLPILVMNADEDSFEECIRYGLEPAIFSAAQLDQFIKELILQGKSAYPIHLKVETGMKRLGFEFNELTHVLEMLQAQPEVRVASVYSHLADSDNRRDKRFTEHQLNRFQQAVSLLDKHLNYPFDKHILNSEGISNFPEAAFDMVRLGIGMYGISGNPIVKKQLQSVLSWYSAVSQIKKVKKGESAGYSRSFIAEKDVTIAIVPVGYADGFKRELSNGKGKVFVQGKACPVVGRVCMDMILVDIGTLQIKEGEPVEILGKNQSIEELAAAMDTIPYEVMTGISRRVHRVYTED